jgi:hypothetical protein
MTKALASVETGMYSYIASRLILQEIPSHVRILDNKVADGLTRPTIKSGNVFEQITTANYHRILA